MRYFIVASLLLAVACSAQSAPPSDEIEADLPINIEDLDDMDEETAEAIIGSINPLENDLRGLEVAIRVHQGFLIKPDGAFFMLGVIDGGGETRLDEEFIMVETTGIESESLTAQEREDFTIETFTLDTADHGRMNAADLILQELKRTSTGENQLTFNAGARTCANPDLDTPDQYRIAFFVRSSPDVDFIPLSAGDLIVEKEDAGAFEFAWEDCAP